MFNIKVRRVITRSSLFIECSFFEILRKMVLHASKRHFSENISNSINRSFTLFLSVLLQYFIFDRYEKL